MVKRFFPMPSAVVKQSDEGFIITVHSKQLTAHYESRNNGSFIAFHTKADVNSEALEA